MRPLKSQVLPLASLAMLVLAGCHDSTGPDNPFNDPNVLGTAVQPVTADFLGWVPGTSRIAYVTYPSNVLGFLDIPADTTSLRADTACVARGTWGEASWVTSPDGSQAYYIECGGIVAPLRRLTLATGTYTTLRQGVSGDLLIDSQGTRLAYGAVDSIFVFDLARGVDSLVALLPRGRVVTFSPDGTELLFDTVDANNIFLNYFRVSLSTGAVTPVPEIGGVNDGVAWTPAGFQYVFDARLYDVTTGHSMPFNANIALTWSSDGKLVAGWASWCSDFECTKQRQVLSLANWSNGQVKKIAEDSCDGILGGVAFSPDNRTIVYSVCGQVYRTQIQ